MDNYGCNCGGHHVDKCPPVEACDLVKTDGNFCNVGEIDDRPSFEREVIIAQVPLSVTVESDICLPCPANDIKNIRKNVHLTQCRVIPIPPDKGNTTTDISLFIEGYVHKNIQYTESCDGYVRDLAVNVPFKCYQRLTDVNPVVFMTSQKSSQIDEIREIDAEGMGSNRCSFGSFTFEEFNEPVKCRLLRSEITEMDFPYDFDCDGHFNKLTEKMTIDLLIRLTQNQRMVMDKKPGHGHCRDHGHDHGHRDK